HGPGRLRVRERSVGPTARGGGTGRCHGAHPARSTGRVPEPRGGGERVPVRGGTATKGGGGLARGNDLRRRARHPFAARCAHGGRLHPSASVGFRLRRAARDPSGG